MWNIIIFFANIENINNLKHLMKEKKQSGGFHVRNLV